MNDFGLFAGSIIFIIMGITFGIGYKFFAKKATNFWRGFNECRYQIFHIIAGIWFCIVGTGILYGFFTKSDFSALIGGILAWIAGLAAVIGRKFFAKKYFNYYQKQFSERVFQIGYLVIGIVFTLTGIQMLRYFYR